MKRLGRVAALLLVAGVSVAQTTTSTTTTTSTHTRKKAHTTRKKAPGTAAQIEALKTQMHDQQAQIDSLKSQVADKDQQLSNAQQSTATAQQAAAAASAKADAASSSAQQAQDQVNTLQNSVTDLKSTSQGLQETVVANQAKVDQEINSPLALHYKGVTITPVAFFAFEGVYRQRSLNSDVNTPFNSIPLPSANEGHVSELNFSGRQSRLGGLFEGNAGAFKLQGYFEADFLGTGTSSNNNQSNSYVLRQRQIFGRVETNSGLALTGGQMWSLVTENGVSTNNRTEKLPNTIDSQYMVGFSWTRQPALRLQKRFGDVKTGAFTAAASVEQAQITGFTASGPLPANFFFAGNGSNGGLYNAAAGSVSAATSTCTTPTGTVTCITGVTAGNITTYANNVAPDVIVKGAFDFPKAHIEVGGLGRFLRDYYFPITSVTGTTTADTYTYASNYTSHTSAAGGVFGSVRVSPSKFADLAVQAMAGQGVGRYGSSQLADATLRPDGTLEPLRNYHGMLSIETHPTPKLDVFGYYGGEYAQRTVYTTATGAQIGYGTRNLNDGGCYNLPANPGNTGSAGGSDSPSSCGSPTRYIQEGMAGLTYRVANSPKFGRLQYSLTYSYLQRNLWSGVGSATTPSGPRAVDNMVHVGMRYYIP